jgi:hypothetical protein
MMTRFNQGVAAPVLLQKRAFCRAGRDGGDPSAVRDAAASHWLIDGLTGAGFDVLYVCYFGCPGGPKLLAFVMARLGAR